MSISSCVYNHNSFQRSISFVSYLRKNKDNFLNWVNGHIFILLIVVCQINISKEMYLSFWLNLARRVLIIMDSSLLSSLEITNLLILCSRNKIKQSFYFFLIICSIYFSYLNYIFWISKHNINDVKTKDYILWNITKENDVCNKDALTEENTNILQ